MQVTLKANISRLENVIVVLTSTDPETIMTIVKSEDFRPVASLSSMVTRLSCRFAYSTIDETSPKPRLNSSKQKGSHWRWTDSLRHAVAKSRVELGKQYFCLTQTR